MNSWRIKTEFGPVIFSAESPNPTALMIHGFRRSADQLVAWRDRIPGLGFIHLPGHGGAPPLTETSIHAWTQAVGAMLAVVMPRPPLLIGESLGAIIALGVPSRAVIAIEPLLSIDDLWPLHQAIARAKAEDPNAGEAFAALFRQPFHEVLAGIRSPTLVLAGSIPLLPPRALHVEPSVLTDEDFAAYAAHPLVQARRIDGGHALLTENPDGVMQAATAFMAEHGYL